VLPVVDLGRGELVARALAAAIAASLLAVSGAGGTTAQTPNLGGTIVFAGVFEPACLNQLVLRCTNSSQDVTFALEKVLLPAFDVDARFKYRPRLVTRVTVSHGPPVTLTYYIRPEARWSDGVPVTAADFLFTHAARLALRSSLDPYARAALLHVRSVTAVDDKTVRVTLRSPFSGWQTLFPNVLPRHVLRGVDLSKIWLDHIDDPKTGAPIGSGPFLVESLERGHELTLIRNPRYWGPHLARVDRLVIRYDVDDPVDPLLQGDLDIARIFPSEVPALRSEPDVRVTAPPSSGYEHFAFRLGSGGHPALRNPFVRRALAYSIDRAAILRALGRPNRRALQSVVYLVQSPYHRANWARYRPRPALARSLFARAGCRRGADGIYSCGGRRLSLRFVTSAGFPTRQTVLATVQAQLRRVGVEVVATYVSNSAFVPRVLPSGRFDVALFGFQFDPNAAGVATIYGCGGRDNYTGYCSRRVSRELARASRMLEGTAQARVLNDADRKIASDVPVLPLYQLAPPTAVRRSVKEFVQLPYNPLADAENWWLDR
jgi:peptide/nickel transport system substrate-binding protein